MTQTVDAILSLDSPSLGEGAPAETAWLIEFPETGDSYRGGARVGPATERQYYRGGGRRTPDHSEAVRFSRKVDAETVLAELDGDTVFRFGVKTGGFVCEHMWIEQAATPTTNAPVAEQKWPTEAEWNAHTEADRRALLDQHYASLTKNVATNADMRGALEPFAAFAADNTDDEGWAGNCCQNDRIRDWFGPSDFRRARTVLQGDQS